MPHDAWAATACVLNGRLYVMGGFDSNRLQVLEMTEENGLSWSCKAELPAARHEAASCVHDGRIWVMGGRVGGERSASVLTYGAEGDTWEAGPPLPSPCNTCRAAATEDGIFLYGYGDGRARAFRYANAVWSAVAVGLNVVAPSCGSLLLG